MGATIYTAYRNYSRFYLTWSEGGQDIANNRTLIHWTAGVQGQPGYTAYWYSNAIRLNSVYIDGQGNLGAGTWSNITLANGASVPLRSGSIWVGHNADGTKGFSASVSGWFYGNGDVSASGSWGIATIPRNSQVTTNRDTYTLGEPITIYTNRKSDSFTHAITIRKDNSGGQVLKTFNSITDAVTWTPTSDEITMLQNLVPNSNNLVIWIWSHNNQVSQGSEAYRTLVITNANPVFNNFVYRDSNSAVVSITGNDQVLVKGQSILETTIPVADKMVAVKGASPSRYSIVYEGVTEQETYSNTEDVVSTFPLVNAIGQRTIIATAFDTRNNNTSTARQVTVYDYSAPTIETSIERENNFGSDTTVHVNGNWTPLAIDGSDKNALTIGSLKYRYREVGGAFNSWTVRTFTVTNDTWEIATDFVVSLDNQKKYEFEFQLSDKFQTTFVSDSVDIGKPIMFVGENGEEPAIGIGKMPENGALDVEGDVYSNGIKLAYAPVITTSGGWTTIDYGLFKQHRKKGTTAFTIAGNSWMDITGTGNLPPGMSSIGTSFVEVATGCLDPAVTVDPRIASTLTTINFNLTNRYGGTVSNTIDWSICITQIV